MVENSIVLDGSRRDRIPSYRPAVARVYSPDDTREHFPGHPADQNLVVLSAKNSDG